MTKNKKWGFGISLSVAVLLLVGYLSYGQQVQGSAPSGLPAGPTFSFAFPVTAVTLAQPVATSTCSARRLSTASTTLMWTVGTSTPTASFGTFLAASSTVVIDGGIDGCGALKVFPFQTGVISVVDIQ